jgi:hypothetical protein
MTIDMRPYARAADLQRILDLKRACTTPENMYDAPTLSELRALLAPLPQDPAAARPPWEDEQGESLSTCVGGRGPSRRPCSGWRQMADFWPTPSWRRPPLP